MVGEAKFITYHGLKMKEMPIWYLINAVEQSEWTIHYGFSDNEKCNSSGVADTDDFEQQLKDSVEKVVQLWLQPLREQFDNIVTTFVMEHRETVPVTAENKLLFSFGAGQQVPADPDAPAHLRITFHCMQREGKGQYPRSFIEMGTSPQVHMFHFRSAAEEGKEDKACHAGGECDQNELFPDDRMSSEHIFMLTVMVHEVGHAFGLGDVYIEPEPKETSPTTRDTINYSTGGSEKTVGKQPHSVMGVANIVALQDGELLITPDDEEAIKWLYLQAHQSAPLDACPSDYVEEKATNGCIPRFPLILATREGDYQAVLKLLEDDAIDLDSCDRYGNTALFYAQQGKHGHGDEIATLLQESGASQSVTCATAPQKQAEKEEHIPLTTEDVSQADATTKSNKLDQISCSTLAHSHPSAHLLLLLLLLLPVFGNAVYHRKSS